MISENERIIDILTQALKELADRKWSNSPHNGKVNLGRIFDMQKIAKDALSNALIINGTLVTFGEPT